MHQEDFTKVFPSRHNIAWSSDEDAILVDMVEENDDETIATRLERTVGSVRARKMNHVYHMRPGAELTGRYKKLCENMPLGSLCEKYRISQEVAQEYIDKKKSRERACQGCSSMKQEVHDLRKELDDLRHEFNDLRREIDV